MRDEHETEIEAASKRETNYKRDSQSETMIVSERGRGGGWGWKGEKGEEKEATCVREREIERTREWQREGWRGSNKRREENNKQARESEGKAKIEQ